MDENRMYHNRKSKRLKGYDYATPGAYFITIVSYKRLPIFGEIISGEVQLSQIGEIVESCWQDVPLHFKSVSIDAYVIMPNHFHGILNIKDTQHAETPSSYVPSTRSGRLPFTEDNKTHPTGASPKSLGAIIGSFKSAATKRIHQLLLLTHPSIWQRNYYEHVIRDVEDYQRIIEYIQFNPINWEYDQEFIPSEPLYR